MDWHVIFFTLICFSGVIISGGTIVAALDLLKDRGISNKQIKVVLELAEILL